MLQLLLVKPRMVRTVCVLLPAEPRSMDHLCGWKPPELGRGELRCPFHAAAEVPLGQRCNGMRGQRLDDDSSKQMIPPLDLCIRTRWKNATVSWNGSEQIL